MEELAAEVDRQHLAEGAAAATAIAKKNLARLQKFVDKQAEGAAVQNLAANDKDESGSLEMAEAFQCARALANFLKSPEVTKICTAEEAFKTQIFDKCSGDDGKLDAAKAYIRSTVGEAVAGASRFCRHSSAPEAASIATTSPKPVVAKTFPSDTATSPPEAS